MVLLGASSIPAQLHSPTDLQKQVFRNRAQLAIHEFTETHSAVKQFFSSIHEESLNEFSRPRILALLSEANVVADIPVPSAQDCVQDYMWMEKSFQRKTIWLQSIVRKCQAILQSAQEMAAKLCQMQFYGQLAITSHEEFEF
jgi:hypothetical protein